MQSFKNKSAAPFLAIAFGLVIFSVALLSSHVWCSPARAFCPQPKVEQESVSEIAPHYFKYSDEKLAQSLAENKRIVLYFHANWCTTCTNFDQELKSQTTQLPTDLVILQINYDTEKELRGKYNVNYQHTLVLLDSQGKTQEMWIGGDLQSLLQFLKDAN